MVWGWFWGGFKVVLDGFRVVSGWFHKMVASPSPTRSSYSQATAQRNSGREQWKNTGKHVTILESTQQTKAKKHDETEIAIMGSDPLRLSRIFLESFLACCRSTGLGFGRSLEEMNRTDVPHLPIIGRTPRKGPETPQKPKKHVFFLVSSSSPHLKTSNGSF